MRSERRTDVTKLIGAFRDCANGPKMAVRNDEYYVVSVQLVFIMFVNTKWP